MKYQIFYNFLLPVYFYWQYYSTTLWHVKGLSNKNQIGRKLLSYSNEQNRRMRNKKNELRNKDHIFIIVYDQFKRTIYYLIIITFN